MLYTRNQTNPIDLPMGTPAPIVSTRGTDALARSVQTACLHLANALGHNWGSDEATRLA